MRDLNAIEKFQIFCLESYGRHTGKSGTEVLSDFNKHDIFNFLEKGFDVLHTQGEKYITDTILSIMNRNGASIHKFDVVKGPVANDTLYATLSLFESGILTKKETIARLKTHKLFDQISFHNQAALNKLVFTKSYTL